MVEISPFRGLRYDLSQVGELAEVVAPPYDVIDAAFQEKLYKQHPCNVIRLELNRAEPGDTGPEDRYRRASDFLKHWRMDGVLQLEHEPAVYVYHQVFDWAGETYCRRAVLVRLKLEEFGQGQVFPHEQTLSGPKADRLQLLKATRTNLSPIFGLYPDDDGDLQGALDEACLSLTALETHDHLGVLHRVWPVTDPRLIAGLQAGLRDRPVFIADGHHRYETGLNYRGELAAGGEAFDAFHPANFIMAALVGMQDPGLAIMPTHRLISGLPDLASSDLYGILEPYCQLELVAGGADEAWGYVEAEGSQQVMAFGTAEDGQWLVARLDDTSEMAKLAPEHTEAWRGLGVSLLKELVIGKWLKARYPNSPMNIEYVHLVREASQALSERRCDLACLVPPATIDDVQEIAAGNEIMPAKSTYFYPKMLTGLVFNPLS